MDKDRLAKEVYESTENTGLPRRVPQSEEVIDGKQYVTCVCGCEGLVINGVERDGVTPAQFLGWMGCATHQYDDDGDLIGFAA
jgi:hypothetical protein